MNSCFEFTAGYDPFGCMITFKPLLKNRTFFYLRLRFGAAASILTHSCIMGTFATECTNGFFVNANVSSITSVGLLRDEFVDAVVCDIVDFCDKTAVRSVLTKIRLN